MNNWEKMSKQAAVYKKAYPVGTRIYLEYMGDDPRPIPPGTRGTVRIVDDMGTVHCDFDNGRRLGLVPGEDSFRKLTPLELADEARDIGKPSINEYISDAERKSNETPSASIISRKNDAPEM